jgi:two-component system, OmpR family, phosphate regulon response regulator PhoB
MDPAGQTRETESSRSGRASAKRPLRLQPSWLPAYRSAVLEMPVGLYSRNPARRDAFRARLASAGIEASAAASSEHLFDLYARFGCGLALLDAEEPRREPDLLERLLGQGLEVIALGDIDGASEGLACDWLNRGLTDYLPDLLPPKLWCAKIGARLRGLGPVRATPKALACGHLKIETETRTVWTRRGSSWRRAERFTRTEIELLSLFMRHGGQVLRRPFILGHLWKLRAEAINSETVNKHVQAIRRKLGPAGRSLTTVFGEGYVLREPA